MEDIKVTSQVLQDLADGSQNTNDMTLGLGTNYTAYSALIIVTGGA
jgi:hypothetical protein